MKSAFVEMIEELADSFETATWADGSEFVRLKESAPEWVRDAVYEARGSKLPDNTTFDMLAEVSAFLVDTLEEGADEGDARESLAWLEPDVYTSDLTKWLAARDDHVYYITQALEELGPFDDGFRLLAAAQKCQLDEIAYAVIEAASAQADMLAEERAYDDED